MASTLNLFTTFLFTHLFAVLSVRRDLFTYMVHCLMLLSLDRGGSVFWSLLKGLFCYTLLSVFSSLQSS